MKQNKQDKILNILSLAFKNKKRISMIQTNKQNQIVTSVLLDRNDCTVNNQYIESISGEDGSGVPITCEIIYLKDNSVNDILLKRGDKEINYGSIEKIIL